MLRIGIILGSTRPGRNGEAVARWVFEKVRGRGDAEYELLDVADFGLPLLDEPVPPSMDQYSKPHTKRWAQAVGACDGFVFVTPEYNHATSGALKNAIDFLYKEWNNKVAGFVAYGSVGGTRAVENLRLICAELQMATVRAQVAFTLADDFENYKVFKPRPHHEKSLDTLLDQLLAWTRAMQTVRAPGVAIASTGKADESHEEASGAEPA